MRIRFDRHFILRTAGAAALFIYLNAAPALAQNTDMSGRLSRIENEIQTLSRAVFKGETPPPGAFTGEASGDTLNRLSQIERDLQTLTGRVEELSYDINRLKNATQMGQMGTPAAPPVNAGYNAGYGGGMNGSVSGGSVAVGRPGGMDVNAGVNNYINGSGANYEDSPSSYQGDGTFRMSDPDAAAGMNAPSTGQLGSMSSSANLDGPTAAYENAFAMLRNQDYTGAQAAFDAFIKQNPGHALIPNATYWLGETHYVRNEFDQAARIFAESYQKYPKGAKAPDNLLKLALSLNGLGKGQDACVALAQLKKEYPAGAAPVLSRADQEIARLNCNVR